MGTHFLKLIAISGREKALALEPEFDFYRAQTVLRLEIDFGRGFDPLPSLRLDLAYNAGSNRYKLGVLFKDVRELKLPTMTPMLEVPELEIEDIRDRMMEGIRFEAVSTFDYSFRCTCGNISILSLERE